MMSRGEKPAGLLRVADLALNPVWRFVGSDSPDETFVRPVARIPVADLAGKLVGTRVLLANKRQVWAMIGNVHSNNPRLTEQFITLSIEHNDDWFHLAR